MYLFTDLETHVKVIERYTHGSSDFKMYEMFKIKANPFIKIFLLKPDAEKIK